MRKLSQLLGASTEEATATPQPEAAQEGPGATSTVGGGLAPQRETQKTPSPSKKAAGNKKKAAGQKRGRGDEPSQPAKRLAVVSAQPSPLALTSGGPVHLGVGSTEEHALESTPPSLWHFRHIAPLKPGQAPTMHDPRRFCPSWELSINDRTQFPEVARELMVGSVLPRDKRWMELANPSELLDAYYTAQAQANAAGTALATRFSELSPDLEKLRKKNLEAEKKLS